MRDAPRRLGEARDSMENHLVRTLMRRSTAIAACVLALCSTTPSARVPAKEAPQNQPRPRLVVLLVVDQLRASYLTEYDSHLTAGLRRLMRDGAWFTNGAYPYLNTVTCSGHSTIGTGAFPYRHGMILNAWLDRETGRSPYCTDDAETKDISYNGLPPGTGNSARRLAVPSLAEQVHARGGRAAALSLKPRSAIPLAGRKVDAVIWFDDRGGWSTSSAFARAPVPPLQQFIDANPMEADYDKVWERTLDAARYRYEDDAEAEGRTAGWTRAFPHPLGTPGGKPDGRFYARWQRSPFADEYLGRMAAALVDAWKLGRADRTDFLGVSFSSLDLVGHAFGPRSHEVQDLLIRLDRTIGRLLDHLDKTVGPSNYVIGMSADHGVADVPEQAQRGGRQTGAIAAEALMKVLVPALGDGDHVAATNYTDIYLTEWAYEKVKSDPRLLEATMAALRSLPAIDRVFLGEDLATAGARSSRDPVMRAAALSYFKGRSGDFIVVPKEQWLLSSSVTTHGTHYPYDQRVPVILFGAGIKAGTYAVDATPADLAPTLAAIAGVETAPADGRVLKEGLR